MIRPSLKSAFLVIALLWACPWPSAAQVTTGLPPFGSFSGGPDVVNNINHNDHITIPVVHRAGRGIPFSYALAYDSTIWSTYNGGYGGAWTPSTWGWSAESSAMYGSFHFNATQALCPGVKGLCVNNGTCTYVNEYNNWEYIDPAGTPHSIAGTVYDYSACSQQGHGAGSATATSHDGSGWTMTFDATPEATLAYDVHGDTFDLLNGDVKDPNGNEISGTSTVYDTLSSTTPALSISGSGTPASPFTYTYTAASGQQETLTVKFQSFTVQTNFGCSGVIEFGPLSQNLVSEIDLPDGSKYTFAYEGTPGYSGNVTGRLAKMTLPRGGEIDYAYSGGSNGINCSDGSTAILTRTEKDNNGNAGVWTYGPGYITAPADPQGNQAYTVLHSQSGYETERDIYQTQGGTLLESIYTCYNGTSFPCNSTAVSQPITQSTVTTSIGGLESQVNTDYNSYGMPTETDEYGFGSGAVGAKLRQTLTTYVPPGTYINDRPSSVTVNSGSGTQAASTSYSYDGNGNMLSASSGGLTSSYTYSSTGTVATATDVNGNQTSYTYGSGSCNGAFPTSVSLPLSLSTSATWNCYAGLMASSTDANGEPTTYTNSDPFSRLTAAAFPDGGSSSITYTSPTQTDVYTAVTASTTRHDQSDLDGLGRPITSSLVNDPDGQTYGTTSYDALGRPLSASNPYRGSSGGGDTYQYDALTRATKVTHADSSYSQISYGGSASQSCPASTYGYGYPTLYRDESGNQRQTFTDALGRLIEVDEPNSGGSLTVNTCYSYDTLNNLYQVIQGSETRTFSHDALSRLTQAITPEAGTVNLYYTASGGALCSGSPKAVCQRTDARGITTTYSYDALSRLTGKSYSNNNPTATAYTYDQTNCLGLSVSCYNKGRRTTMTDASGSTEWAYDAMGRILLEHRTINSVTNNIAYTYNLDGSTATLIYPSGRTITYSVKAAQRPQSAVDTADSINYVTEATYAPQGAVSGALMGPSGGFGGITFAATYTNRLLPYTVSATSSAGTALNLTFGYYANANVETITNNLNTARTQTFAYDNLNRLATAQTQATSGQYCWGQSFGYDRYANLLSATVTQCTATALSLSVNTNNQITNSGFSYDYSGDMTSDGTYTYVWDARNLLYSAGGVTYTYDGDGKRVMKSNGTLYWNSPGGTPLAETNSSGTTLNEYIFFGGARIARRDSSGNVYYYFQDQLGTTKTLTTSAGVVCYDADFLPFGVEMAYTNSCAQNYKFTGMERDGETGNDHTLYRMYESSLGHWLSPDSAGVDLTNPQSLNRYAYVRNNPTTLTDPLGLFPVCYSQTTHSMNQPTAGCGGFYDDGSDDPSGIFGSGGNAGYSISDALGGAAGTYISYDIYGNISFGFSVDLWRQTNEIIDAFSEDKNYVGDDYIQTLQFGAISGLTTYVDQTATGTETSGVIVDYSAALAEFNNFWSANADQLNFLSIGLQLGVQPAPSPLLSQLRSLDSNLAEATGNLANALAPYTTVVYTPIVPPNPPVLTMPPYTPAPPLVPYPVPGPPG